MVLLHKANAITVDGSILITECNDDIGEITGDTENEVVRVEWHNMDLPYSMILTEGGIAEGRFEADDKFVCVDHRGESTVIQFYAITRLHLM